jgi:hypothetical protein
LELGKVWIIVVALLVVATFAMVGLSRAEEKV